MSIRWQLVLIALTTLVLPWAGCQYARELETTLRVSQENALQAAAETIAHALSAQPQRVFGNRDAGPPFDPLQGDVFVFPLHNQPLLDGYREDWGLDADPAALRSAGLAARLLAGATERYLFLYLEVDAPRFAPEPSDAHPEHDVFDRVDLTLERPDGALESYFFATAAPGLIAAQMLVKGEDGVDHAAPEPRIQAFWQQTTHGFHVEARIPRSLVGGRLWIDARAGGAQAGFAAAGADGLRGGRLFGVTAGLDELLATFIGRGVRATVVDTNALKLGQAGSIEWNPASDQPVLERAWFRSVVSDDTSGWPLQTAAADRMSGASVTAALAGRPAAEWLQAASRPAPLLVAAAPVAVDGRTRGAIVLEQAGDQLLDRRDLALAHLFNLTLLATGLAIAIAFGIASWIGVRIGRLGLAADTAVGNDGRIRLGMPEAARADEIGALARAFERLLARLNEHTQYLRTLGGKLSHELRTPLSIVRSSLDNLESGGLRPDQRGFVTRAREGAQRLQSILSALGAAARVEESIKQADRTRFDLAAVLRSAVAGYRDAFPRSRIVLNAPDEACSLQGAPDLLVQLLDKLVENAVDYCSESGCITIGLRRSGDHYELTVSNDGPAIPAAELGSLFESLYEHREGRDDRPHFGLGLYIVRLIVEFHGGSAAAANRADGTGPVFTVNLPLV